MKKIFIFTVLIFFAAFAQSWAEDAAQRIQGKYNNIKDIKGSFEQKSFIKDLEETQEFKGNFSIKMPFRMRWAYTKPTSEEVIINDKKMWILQNVEKQAVKSNFSEDTYGQAPIALLAGLGNLNKDFDVKDVEILHLLPKKKENFRQER